MMTMGMMTMATPPEYVWKEYRVPQLTRITVQEYAGYESLKENPKWQEAKYERLLRAIAELTDIEPEPLPKETPMTHVCTPPKSGTTGALHACKCGQHWAHADGMWRAVARLKYVTLEAELQFQSTGTTPKATEPATETGAWPLEPLALGDTILLPGGKVGGEIIAWRYYEHPTEDKSYLAVRLHDRATYKFHCFGWYGRGRVASIVPSRGKGDGNHVFALRKSEPSIQKVNLDNHQSTTWFNTTSSKRHAHGYKLISNNRR